MKTQPAITHSEAALRLVRLAELHSADVRMIKANIKAHPELSHMLGATLVSNLSAKMAYLGAARLIMTGYATRGTGGPAGLGRKKTRLVMPGFPPIAP